MPKPRISAVVAISGYNRTIGKDNELLWDLPEDLKRFKEITFNHPVIMGRKTWESIPEKFRPLPGRTNIIITRQKDFTAPSASIVRSVDEALAEAKKHDREEIFIIGGQQIYEQTLPMIDRLYLTLVDSHSEGDAFFPDYSEFSKVISREDHPKASPPFTWLILERK